MKRLMVCRRFFFVFFTNLFVCSASLLHGAVPTDVPVAQGAALQEKALQETNPASGSQRPLEMQLGKPDGVDLEQLQKVLLTMMTDFQKKKEDARRHLLELLPEADHALILQAREHYEDFLEEVNLATGLAHACAFVSTTLNDVLKQDSARVDQLLPIICHLDKLHQGLVDGSFMSVLNNGQEVSAQGMFNPMQFMQGMQKMGIPAKTESRGSGLLTKQDIDGLVNVLANTVPVAVELSGKQFAQAWSLLQTILLAIKKNDMQLLTSCYMEHLEPYVKRTQVTLTDVSTELDKKLAQIPLSGDSELRRAYVLLTRELKNYLRTLMVFSSLKQSATNAASNTHTLFTLIAYSFDFYRNIFSFYAKDYEVYLFREGLFDLGLRSALATWHFFMQKSDFSKGLLFNTIQGNTPVSSLSPVQLLMYNAILAPFAMIVFFNPSFWNKQVHGSLREFGKVLASWVYYHVFHCFLFDDMARGESTFLVHYDGVDSVWPRDYEHLRKTLFNALNEGQRYAFKELSEYLRMNFYPQEIETVERCTMGIVRPELMGYMFETFLPLFMLNRENLVNEVVRCQPEDVYGDWFNGNIQNQYIKRYLSTPGQELTWFDNEVRNLCGGPVRGRNNNIDARFFKQHMSVVLERYAQREQVDIKAYYVECRLLSYVFSSLGMHWGRILTQKYQSALSRMISKGTEKALNLCATLGLISYETAEMFKEAKNEFNEGMDEAVSMLKELFKSVFVPGSAVRAMIIPILEHRGDIESHDNVDSLAVTKEVLHTFLRFLARSGLMAYIDVEILLQKFEQDPTKANEIVDQIVSVVRANLIAMVGGHVGSYVASLVGCGIMWSYGPFYPKIQNKLATL